MKPLGTELRPDGLEHRFPQNIPHSPMPEPEQEFPSFRTKTGVCTITPTQVLISRDGARGALARLLIGKSVWRALVLHSVTALLLFGLGVRLLMSSRTVTGALLCFIGALLLRAVVRSRNNTAASEIARTDVVKLEAHPPRTGVTRGYFTVHYREGSAVKKRAIILPGSLSGGAAEYSKAKQILADEGLL
ncbi:MAG: hypothetical protein JRH11_23725, partial [Deltaproteobacteria bacterium]|nr:hypothetical protein [Deltaproteobacteria bacterium]